MTTYNLKIDHRYETPIDGRCGELAKMHQINREVRVVYPCDIRVEEGDIVFFTGPPGSGKTTLLDSFRRQVSGSVADVTGEICDERPLIDCVGESDSLLAAIRAFTIAGISDVYDLVSPPGLLGRSKQFGFNLARAVAAKAPFIFVDDFCGSIDSLSACNIAHNIRHRAGSISSTFVLASGRVDFLADLSPDVLVRCERNGKPEVLYRKGE